MDGPDPSPWFVGDLDDAWVAAIADALPRGAVRLSCAGDLPDPWPAEMAECRTLIVHRSILTDPDAQRLRRLRSRDAAPRIILIVGPHARYRDLERWAPLVDAILPEATALETIARHVADLEPGQRPPGPRPALTVVSGLFDLRLALVDAFLAAGYPAEAARDWREVRAGGMVVWDVPVLEPGWPDLLAREASGRTVVALLGFADRETVALARARGASACLDLPCDPADLTFVLDRFAVGRLADPAHVVPPAPAALRRSRSVPDGRPETGRL